MTAVVGLAVMRAPERPFAPLQSFFWAFFLRACPLSRDPVLGLLGRFFFFFFLDEWEGSITIFVLFFIPLFRRAFGLVTQPVFRFFPLLQL